MDTMKSAILILILLLLPSLALADTLQKGLEQKQKGDCPAAVRTLESYSEDHPESFQAWEALAQCYYEMGIAGNAINMNLHDASRRAAIRAFRLDQSKKDLLYTIGMTSLSVDDQAMAIGSYELLAAAGENDQAGKLKNAMSAYEPPQMDGGYTVAVSRHGGGSPSITTMSRMKILNDVDLVKASEDWDRIAGPKYISTAGKSKAERVADIEAGEAKAKAKATYLNGLMGIKETPEKMAQDEMEETKRKHVKEMEKLKRDAAIARSNMEKEMKQLENDKQRAESEKRRMEAEKQLWGR